jgi:large subunit ribosomal protein L25
VSQVLNIKAEPRDRAGKGVARAARRAGLVPAVIYGGSQAPELVNVDGKILMKMLNKGTFMSSVVEVDLGGKVQRALPRDVQFHPVTDRPLHVDFFRLVAGSTITVMVPVHFRNETASPGLKRGGVLNIVRHEVEVECPADDIPEELVVDLTGRDIHDSIHISAVTMPEGVRPTIRDRDFTVATLVAPSGLRSDIAGEAAEG